MPNPYKRLSVKQTIDLLQKVTDGSLDQGWRLSQAKQALWEHLRSLTAAAQKKDEARGR